MRSGSPGFFKPKDSSIETSASGMDLALEKFNPDDFYSIKTDDKVEQSKLPLTVQLNLNGAKLVAQYYQKKYQTQIVLPETTPEEDKKRSSKDKEPSTYLSEEYFFAHVTELLKEARTHPGDYRQAFLIGVGSDHTIPIIYIKEGESEGILYANSKFLWDGFKLKELEQAFLESSTGEDTVILAVKNSRQADFFSCTTDALVFGRETTGKDPNTNEYLIPNLLENLASRIKDDDIQEGYMEVKLPNKLLKTSQISSFVEEHSDKKDLINPIHKDQDLKTFREIYTEKDVLIVKTDFKKNPPEIKKVKANISNYLKIKGWKYTKLVAMQFYINQFTQKIPDLFNEEARKDFISGAKTFFAEESVHIEEKEGAKVTTIDKLYDFSNIFLKKLLNNSTSPRPQPT